MPQVLSGLAAVGYTLLAVPTCETIQGPTIRSAIQSYMIQRGLSIVFAPQDGARQLPRELMSVLYTPEVDAASAQYVRGHQVDQRHVGGAGGTPSCYAEALAAHSGPGGWNDPRALLPAPTALRAVATGVLPARTLLAQLRTNMSRRCLRGEPLLAAPGLVSLREEPLRSQVLRILSNPLALGVHTLLHHLDTPSQPALGLATASNEPPGLLRLSASTRRLPPNASDALGGVGRWTAWGSSAVRGYDPDDADDGASTDVEVLARVLPRDSSAGALGASGDAALLLSNHAAGAHTVRVRVPWASLAPLAPRRAWVRAVWSEEEEQWWRPKPAAARGGASERVLPGTMLEAIDLPPHSCALLLLFSSREDAAVYPNGDGAGGGGGW